MNPAIARSKPPLSALTIVQPERASAPAAIASAAVVCASSRAAGSIVEFTAVL